MLTITLASLRAHARRLAGMSIAVCLGVAFLTGTLVLSDTLRANFDDLFTTAFGDTDVVVRRAGVLATDAESATAVIDSAVAADLEAVDGVRTVLPRIEGFGQITGANGDGIGGNGPPTLAGNWIEDPELNPYEIADGRPPRHPNEVVINRGAAEAGALSVGDVTTIAMPQPVSVTISGISTVDGEDGLGPTTFAAFTTEGAVQHITKRPGAATSFLVGAIEGVDRLELRDRIAERLPAGLEALTGDEVAAEATDAIDADFLGFLTGFLGAFAGVALLVATFSIYNTFAIVVAQRTRESALLRAVGATRRQVFAALLAEGAVVGVAASLTGLVAGLGLAGLLKGLFDAFGFSLPAGGLTLRPTLAAVPLVGIAVTLIAAAAPAVRSSRVAPVAALRGADAEPAHASRVRTLVGGALVVAGAAAGGAGVAAGELALAGAGGGLVLAGAIAVGPAVVSPMSQVLARLLGRTRGVTGALAGRNAARSPKRTAATASALVVGVGVVTVFTVVASSVKASVDRRVADVVASDLLITAGRFGGGGVSPDLARAVESAPGVDTATGLAVATLSIGDRTGQVTIGDPVALDTHLNVTMGDGFAVRESVAEERGWARGDAVDVTFPDGTTERLTIGALYEDAGPLLLGYLVPRDVWERHAVQAIDTAVLISLERGATIEEGRRAVDAAARPFGAPDVQTNAEFVEVTASNIDTALALVYTMLALAILIALMGIGNTLSLAVHERVRELGLLRAVGQSRAQVRSMIRWESVAIAVMGTGGGIAAGVFVGWALVEASGSDAVGFALPAAQLAVIVLIGAIAGVVAAIRPARRAARMAVLDAIATT